MGMDDIEGSRRQIEVVDIAAHELRAGVTTSRCCLLGRADRIGGGVHSDDAAARADDLSEVQGDGPRTAADVEDRVALA